MQKNDVKKRQFFQGISGVIHVGVDGFRKKGTFLEVHQ